MSSYGTSPRKCPAIFNPGASVTAKGQIALVAANFISGFLEASAAIGECAGILRVQGRGW